ncbi:type V CRISPR-associated protein Cas12a/Cpf1 [Candidatus Gottesmanbacteria bacterium]|nr:type V CRISPR-associated protein Cas12a/Cpf1 [Candidatus Gottesmanbacteria bacterium]
MVDSLFSDFTNIYSLSKTLRFELKPIGNTQKMLEENQVYEKDKLIEEKYQKTKPFLDRIHREFATESLVNASLSGLEDYFQVLKQWQENKENKKALRSSEAELRNQIGQFFNDKAKTWSEERYSNLPFKNKDIELFFEEEVFSLLKQSYGKEEGSLMIDETTRKQISIFDTWKGFIGYFKKFFETRKNLYRTDGSSTAIATRIIDQNLKRFCFNMQIFEKIKDKIDLTETELNFAISLDELFSLNYYNKCLLQDGIDYYNRIVGGETKENGEKLKGVNEIINKYHQDHKKEKIPFLTPLDRQILSEKEKFRKEIENDDQLLATIREFYDIAEEKSKILQALFTDFVSNNESYALEEIYLSRQAFNTISGKWTEEKNKLEKWLYEAMKPDKPTGLKYEKIEDSYNFPDFIALSYLKTALETAPTQETVKFWRERYYLTKNDPNRIHRPLSGSEPIWNQFLKIFNFEFSSIFKNEVRNQKSGEQEVIGYDIYKKYFRELADGKNITITPESKIVIKNFADTVLLQIYAMGTYFAVEKKRAWLMEYSLGEFYTDPEIGYLKFYDNAYEGIVQNYNLLRNYLTKKPWDGAQKWKLNFENSTLADGWDKNKESDNFAVILRKENQYFLGIMKKGHSKIFSDRNETQYSDSMDSRSYEKMVYKFFPDPSKMFPKVCFSEKGINYFNPPKKVLDIYEKAEFKKGDSFNIYSMHELIDFYRNCLTMYEGWKDYDFKNLRPTQEYTDNIGEFYTDVSRDGYRISFKNISQDYINKKNLNGELYLFEIYNQDFAIGKTGKKNLHSLYFEGIFSPENAEIGFPLKLNGDAEIFFRPKSIEVQKERRKYTRDIVKHQRYTQNKIFFHSPITLNRGLGDINSYQFNSKVNSALALDPNINIIGVDRGEKHLAYYSVIDQNGKPLENGSLNTINKVDYADKLEERAGGREQARKDWQSVESIKDLKKGYISQVVRRLADLSVKYNAIIVLEDLSMRFKQIRGGIEKSIYQQLEKALIEKLNFLVNKNEINFKKAGHLFKAYQLTGPFETFREMGKQTGIIFYTQASYTSKIDPLTGWRPSVYLKYSSAENAKKDIKKFTDIIFDKNKNRFEFTYDLKKFLDQKEYPSKTIWTVCSCVERHRWNKTLHNNKGGYDHHQNITEDFRQLFVKYNIDYESENFFNMLTTLDTKNYEQFFRNFIFYWSLLCQIRNTDENAKDENSKDYIFSPVEPFFDSRISEKFDEDLPKNGDDNGAFNIARKGIIILRKLSDFHSQYGTCEKMTWGDLSISHNEWDNFAQQT